jgi:hypothetical protein
MSSEMGRPKPRAQLGRFGGEEGFEDARQDLGRMPGPLSSISTMTLTALVAAAHIQAIAPRVQLGQGVGGVDEKIEEDLPQAGGTGTHQMGRTQTPLDGGPVAQLAAQHGQRGIDRGIDVRERIGVVVDTRERMQVARDAMNARHAFLRFLHDGHGIEEQIRQPPCLS